jgi:two-component system, OmpR family, response regulator ResD
VSNAGSKRVLLVEDDATVAEVVVAYLEREGFVVTWKSDGAEALSHAGLAEPDLVILDLMLPSLDGIELCRRLRERSAIPIIMLTARGDEDDRIAGLEVGADDYVAKPFSPRELVARVRAVMRRVNEPAVPLVTPELLEADGLRVDVPAREVSRSDRRVELTALEFDLLAFLMRHPRRVFRREELLELVWGYTYGDASTVTVHVRRLREKIEDDPRAPRFIATVWGVGYRWDG